MPLPDPNAILKDLVIQKWNSGPRFWPVKVMSMVRLQQLEKDNGGALSSVGGYFTCLKNVCTHTPAEMEDILGFEKGAFSSGVSIWKFKELPKPDQFEFRGHTQTPQGKRFDGIVLTRSDQK